jgi:hypothetical protein
LKFAAAWRIFYGVGWFEEDRPTDTTDCCGSGVLAAPPGSRFSWTRRRYSRADCLDLEDSKAEDIVAIALHGKTILADVMIIATGRSNIHVGAIAERRIGAFKGERHKPPRRNCFFSCPSWNLLGLPRYLKNLFLLISVMLLFRAWRGYYLAFVLDSGLAPRARYRR